MKYQDTQFLRALAILLVINSHLDKYYPIPYIGTGGAIAAISHVPACFLFDQDQQKPFRYDAINAFATSMSAIGFSRKSHTGNIHDS